MKRWVRVCLCEICAYYKYKPMDIIRGAEPQEKLWKIKININ